MSPPTARIRVLFAAVLALGAVVLSATPASAHATLTSTEPAGGSAVPAAPGRVVLRFSEAVEIPLGSIRVFASPSGEQIETGVAAHADGRKDAVAVGLPGLGDGNFIVTWRVTSADAHPVHGAFTFTVGSATTGAEDAALVEKLLTSGSGSTTVGAVYAAVRFAAYGGMILLVGGLVFVGAIWPAGAALPRTRRLLWGAWAVTFLATAVGIPVHGVYAAALPLSRALSSTVLSGVLDGRFGQVWSVRLGLLGLMAVMLVILARRSELSGAGSGVPRPLLAGGGVLAVGLLLTPALSGHAATQDLVPLAVVSDVMHLAAVSVWLGGLAFLTLVVLPRRQAGELSAAVPRFSSAAAGAVLAILVTGTFQGWREVRSTAALTDTTYGRLLIAKVLLVALLVGLGALSRRLVQGRSRQALGPARSLSYGPGAATADPDAATAAHLRRTVGAETVIAVVVLAVTALLVNAEPARSEYARPFSAEMRSDLVWVDVTVDPAKAGPADLHFYTLSPQGGIQEVEEMAVRLTQPSREVGPLTVPVERAGPGHFTAYDFNLPLRGDWTLEVTALVSEIDEATLTTTVPVK